MGPGHHLAVARWLWKEDCLKVQVVGLVLDWGPRSVPIGIKKVANRAPKSVPIGVKKVANRAPQKCPDWDQKMSCLGPLK